MRIALFAFCVMLPSAVEAKSFGIRSPSGRTIYDDHETFGEVVPQNTRQFVVEAAIGIGPEGNLAVVGGWLMPQVKGLEMYAGVGVEANPAIHFTFALRYLMNFGGYRPYVGLGYLLNRLTKTGTISQNAFFEVGYSWKIFHTYHLTVGFGARRILHITVEDESPLAAPDVDKAFLDEQIENVTPWLRTFAVRFSRAF